MRESYRPARNSFGSGSGDVYWMMRIKTARTCFIMFCAGAVVAALILTLHRAHEIRRLEEAVRDMKRGNVALSTELRSGAR